MSMAKAGIHTIAEFPIGVFDSGVGGLTVLRALRAELPHEHFLYLGDTARLPYGTKSSGTVARYALQAAEKLVEQQVKMLVIACNTATAAALPTLREAFPHMPVLGVIEPGAQAAVKASFSGRVAVIATEVTIRNEAYTKAILALNPACEVVGIPCPLFVSLAEEGWTGQAPEWHSSAKHALEGQNMLADAARIQAEGAILRAVAERYLGYCFRGEHRPDCILLGCTHFPPLAPMIAQVVGQGVALVDSAATTAVAVAAALDKSGLGRPVTGGRGSWRFLTTDSPERFLRVGSTFLGSTISKDELELIVL